MSTTTHVDQPDRAGRRSWWRPTETDLGAMVGLCRCPSSRAASGSEATVADVPADPETVALAARLSGVLRTGC